MAIKGSGNFTSIARPYNELMERTPNSIPFSDIGLGRINMYGAPSSSFNSNATSASVNSPSSTSNPPVITSVTTAANGDVTVQTQPVPDSGLTSGAGIGTNIGAGSPTLQTPAQMLGGTVAGSSLIDTFIETWLRSRTWKPKAAGFYIDGRTGYIECRDFYSNNIFVEGGQIGGWKINKTQIFSNNIFLTSGSVNQANIQVGSGANTAGLNATGGPGDIAFWAGDTYANRAIAPYSVTAGGSIFAIQGQIGGSTLSSSAITAGIFQTAAAGQRLMMNGPNNRFEVYNSDNTILAFLGDSTQAGTVLKINRTASAATKPVVSITSSLVGADVMEILNTNALSASTCLTVITNASAFGGVGGHFENTGSGNALQVLNNHAGSPALVVINSDGVAPIAAQMTGLLSMFGDIHLNGASVIMINGVALANVGGVLTWNGVNVALSPPNL